MRGIERVFTGVLLVATVAATVVFARSAERTPVGPAVHFQAPPRREAVAPVPVVVPLPPPPRVRTVVRIVTKPAPATVVAPQIVLPPVSRPAAVPARPPVRPVSHPRPRTTPSPPAPPRALASANPPAPPPPAPPGPGNGHAWGRPKQADDETGPPPAATPAAPRDESDGEDAGGRGNGHAYGHDTSGFGNPHGD
jgi:hypothetical protein